MVGMIGEAESGNKKAAQQNTIIVRNIASGSKGVASIAFHVS
jgi:hypothetical protein